MARDFAKVGVVGLGTMGTGIAEVLARNGVEVVGVEVDEAALPTGAQELALSLPPEVPQLRLDTGQRAELE